MRVLNTLDDLAHEAAAGKELRRYLEARGIKAVATLALIASSEDDLAKTLIDPLLAGWKLAEGDTIRLPLDEHPIARAIMTHMWMLARQSWQASVAAAAPAPTPVAPPSSTAASAASGDKVPKTLPAGVWQSLVRAFNTTQLHGRDRCFPVEELLGAECVLARMYHEHNVSKSYTPVGLGEIVQRRSFTAAGEVNPLAKNVKKSTPLSLDDDHQLVQTDDPEWSPKSMLAIIDGITAVKWAMTLVQWGEERDVAEYAAWMVQRVRSRPSKIEQFLTYWTAASWSLVMAMRNGSTFAEASAGVMSDLDKFTDHMAKEPASLKVKPAGLDDPKGKGKHGPGRNKVTRAKLHIDLLRMANLTSLGPTMEHPGTMQLPGNEDTLNLTSLPSPMTLGHGIGIHRNRDSTGPRVPNNILRYPTNFVVRLAL